METNKILLDRLIYLTELANKSIATTYTTQDSFFVYSHVSSETFNEFESASLSFIMNLYGQKHPYYVKFSEALDKKTPANVEAGKGILSSIKTEIERGWLHSLKGLVSAEIFSDFLEMADHLLQEKYKDPAAVMIGSVLEEHLRQLCLRSNITTTQSRSGREIPKKADVMNAELSNAGIYNKLDQKNITAWLDLRNKAAHGLYDEYNLQQVQFIFQSVSEFIARTSN